jgi:hypothetical protein
MWLSSSAQIPHVLALPVSLASKLLISLQRSRCVGLSMTSAYTHGSLFLQYSYGGPTTTYGAFNVLSVVQVFVLGSRLILSIREYHAKLVASSDAETSMNPIVFQERVHVSTSSTVYGNACRAFGREEKFGPGSVVVFMKKYGVLKCI